MTKWFLQNYTETEDNTLSVFPGKYLGIEEVIKRDDRIYFPESIFAFVEEIIEALPNIEYEHFSYNEIEGRDWNQIIKEIKKFIESLKNKEDILIKSKYAIYKRSSEMPEEFVSDLIVFLEGFISLINNYLKEHKIITIMGI